MEGDLLETSNTLEHTQENTVVEEPTKETGDNVVDLENTEGSTVVERNTTEGGDDGDTTNNNTTKDNEIQLEAENNEQDTETTHTESKEKRERTPRRNNNREGKAGGKPKKDNAAEGENGEESIKAENDEEDNSIKASSLIRLEQRLMSQKNQLNGKVRKLLDEKDRERRKLNNPVVRAEKNKLTKESDDLKKHRNTIIEKLETQRSQKQTAGYMIRKREVIEGEMDLIFARKDLERKNLERVQADAKDAKQKVDQIKKRVSIKTVEEIDSKLASISQGLKANVSANQEKDLTRHKNALLQEKETHKELATAIEDLNNLTKKEKEVQAQIEKYLADIKQKKAEKENLNKQIDQELKASKSNPLTDELDNIKKQMATLSKELKVFNQTHKDDNKEINENIAEIDKQVAQLRREVAQTVEELDHVRKQIHSVEIPYEANLFAAIIGAGGSAIRNLRRSLPEVDIQILDPKKVAKIEIRGEKAKVEEAQVQVELMLSEVKLMEFIPIPKSSIGLIIGKGGANLKRIEQETDTQVSIDKRDKGDMIRIKGTPPNVQKAKEMIEAELSSVHSVDVRFAPDMERVFKRKDSYLKKVQEESGIFRVQIEDGFLHVEGKKEQVDKAVEMLNEYIEKLESNRYEVRYGPELKSYFGDRVRDGKKMRNRNVEDIERDSGAFVSVVGSEYKLVVRGSDEVIEKARAAIEEALNTAPREYSMEEKFDTQFIGHLLGRGGSNVRKIEKDYNVRVKISKERGVVSIFGEKEGVSNGVLDVRGLLKEAKTGELSNMWTKLQFEPEELGRLFSHLRNIEEKSQSDVRVFRDNGVVGIKGGDVELAKQLVNEVMEGERAAESVRVKRPRGPPRRRTEEEDGNNNSHAANSLPHAPPQFIKVVQVVSESSLESKPKPKQPSSQPQANRGSPVPIANGNGNGSAAVNTNKRRNKPQQ